MVPRSLLIKTGHFRDELRAIGRGAEPSEYVPRLAGLRGAPDGKSARKSL